MLQSGIRVREATKSFKDNIVFYNVSMAAEPGEITGVVGRNGSGKTVLFKCICGFMPLTTGRITVGGHEIGREVDVPKNIGIIIEAPGFLPNYSGFRNLKFLAGIQRKIGYKQIQETMELVGLDWKSKKPVGKYSLGMRQRLGIAQAIMEDPAYLVLDEPMNGLDNTGVDDMRKLFLYLRELGKTILVASHDANDIDILCDRVYEIDTDSFTQIR
ncbi:MAG: ATP-binding cassette domain-containing protein [Gracilibacteraceae bacterium]|jgi:ABC-2 type transport system ATP-binding protein|nr:ATP-binding cassette domain-containing protein [Gracilibacteraceae bacterium]